MITLNVVLFPSCPFKFTPTYLKNIFVKKVAWFRWHPKNLSPCISITYLYFSCNLICIVLSKVKFPLIQSHFMPKWKVWKKHRGVRNFRNTLYKYDPLRWRFRLSDYYVTHFYLATLWCICREGVQSVIVHNHRGLWTISTINHIPRFLVCDTRGLGTQPPRKETLEVWYIIKYI